MPPVPDSITTDPLATGRPKTPPVRSRQTDTVTAGMGYAAGGCLFWIILSFIIFLVSSVLFVGCLALVASG